MERRVPVAETQAESWEELFQSPPEMVERFEDKLTRNAFMDFIIKSHAGSEGSFGAQIIYVAWVDSQGNRASDAIRSCKDAGGWNSLSDEEREAFITTFNRIQQHTLRIDSEGLISGRFFNDNLSNLTRYFPNPSYEQRVEELSGLSPQEMATERKRIIEAYKEAQSWREDSL